MSSASLAADPGSGDPAASAGLIPADGFVLPADGNREQLGFEFALKPGRRAPPAPPSEPGLDRLLDELHRHSHDRDELRRAAGAIRHTVEASLWQSAHGANSRLPAILAEVFGRSAGLYVSAKLRWLANTIREWLVMLSSPKRVFWAVQAAWKGGEVAAQVREKASWHSVDEIAVYQRDREAPLVRVGSTVAPDEEDWLASNPVFAVTKRYMAGQEPPEHLPAVTDEPPTHTMVVVGKRAEITARITGHAPPELKEELQSLCQSADEILSDEEVGRAEWIFRLKQIVTPALKKKGPEVARKFWNPIVILAVFLTAGAALLGSAGVEHLRWEGVVKQIDAEPGIEVISHSSAWGRREIEMLRDPQAKQVAVLLLQLGADPAAVSVHERPFLSAEEPLLSARQQAQHRNQFAAATATAKSSVSATDASSSELRESVLTEVRLDLLRGMLDLPRDLVLSLAGGELTARGTLTEPAWSRLARAPKKLGWLNKVHLDQVRDVTGENITELRKGLEQINIEFVPASTILPEASKLRLQSVASEMNLLASEARLKQQEVRVQFCASHPGVDAGTVENRVEIIRRDLTRQGVPASWFDPAQGVLDAPGPHVIAFRINLETPSAEP